MAKHILILEISQLSDDCQNHLIMHLRKIETFLGIQGNVVHRIVYPAIPKSSYPGTLLYIIIPKKNYIV